jgi:phospholipid transport system substrate-binding protein
MKRIFMVALLSMALSSTVMRSTAFAATPEAAPVEALDAGLIASMKAGSGGANFAARSAALTPVVAQTYDLANVTQNSVGFLWSTLPAAQQQQLVTLIGQFTVTSYASQFTAFAGETFTVSPTEKTLGQGFIVQSKLQPSGGGDPVELDYAVHNTPQGWRITDVLLGGTISQVALHESDFSSLVSSGDASRLIAALQTKIAKLQSASK